MPDVRLKATRIEVQLAVETSPNAATPQSATTESKMIVLPLIVMAMSVFVGSSIGPVRIQLTFERPAD